MAYRQNNPFSRKTSNPIKQVGVPGLGRAVRQAVDLVNKDPRIDPTFQPPTSRPFYTLVDERGGKYEEGGIAGYRGPEGMIERPTGASVHGYTTGDTYVTDTRMQQSLAFDPESGYSRRILPITYDKTELGAPARAYIDPYAAQAFNLSQDPDFKNIRSGQYNLSNRKDREEFEKIRNKMYENQTRQLERANVMYKLGDSPQEYLGYFQDRQDERDLQKFEDQPYVQKMYSRYGAPGSEKRAKYLADLNERQRKSY